MASASGESWRLTEDVPTRAGAQAASRELVCGRCDLEPPTAAACDDARRPAGKAAGCRHGNVAGTLTWRIRCVPILA